MRNAIEEIGDSIVRDSDIDHDPVFELLARYSDAGALGGLTLGQRQKGEILEVAFAWHIARTCIRNGGHSTLSHVILPLLAPGVDLPDDVGSRIVSVTHACSASSLPLTLATNFHALSSCDAARGCAIIGVEEAAGADVITPLSVGSLITQAKRGRAQLIDALRAASPAWQYVDTPSRTVLTTGVWKSQSGKDSLFVHSAKRRALVLLAAANPPLFESAVRMVLSVKSFHNDSVVFSNAVNDDPSCHNSPVLLCVASEAAFGTDLYAALRRSIHKPGIIAHTDDATVWLPLSILEVEAARMETKAVRSWAPDLRIRIDSACTAARPIGAMLTAPGTVVASTAEAASASELKDAMVAVERSISVQTVC